MENVRMKKRRFSTKYKSVLASITREENDSEDVINIYEMSREEITLFADEKKKMKRKKRWSRACCRKCCKCWCTCNLISVLCAVLSYLLVKQIRQQSNVNTQQFKLDFVDSCSDRRSNHAIDIAQRQVPRVYVWWGLGLTNKRRRRMPEAIRQ